MKLISELLNEIEDMPLVESRMVGDTEKFKLTTAGMAYCLQLLCVGEFISFKDLPEPLGDDMDENLARFDSKMKTKQIEIVEGIEHWLGIVKGLQQKGECPKEVERDIMLMVMFKLHNEQITKKEAS